MNNPCGGTVGPDFERSFNSYSLSISAGTNFPRPTSSSAPTILRTIYRKKDLPCTVNHSSSPSSVRRRRGGTVVHRSEEHTSELQSHLNLVCRLLLEKKTTSL